MDKDKILEKARNEYKEKDLIKKEVDRVSGSYVYWIVCIVAVILIIMNSAVGIDDDSLLIISAAMGCARAYAQFKVTKEESSFGYALLFVGIIVYMLYSYAKEIGLL